MKCQICYKRKATTTVFDKAAGRRVCVCYTCEELVRNKETEEEKRESEQAAEFNAELGAGVYDLP